MSATGAYILGVLKLCDDVQIPFLDLVLIKISIIQYER